MSWKLNNACYWDSTLTLNWVQLKYYLIVTEFYSSVVWLESELKHHSFFERGRILKRLKEVRKLVKLKKIIQIIKLTPNLPQAHNYSKQLLGTEGLWSLRFLHFIHKILAMYLSWDVTYASLGFMEI